MSYGGSNGSGRISTSSDVALNSPADGQSLVYAASTQKWTNVTISGGTAPGLAVTAIKTAAYTAVANDFVPSDASSAAFTVTLPTAPANNTRVAVKKIDISTNAVTVAAGGSDVFNKAGGSTSVALSLLNQTITLQYASASSIWYVASSDAPLSSIVTGQTKTVTVAYTLVNSDHVILADPTSAAFTVTLPTAVGYFGRFTITYTGSSNNLVTVATTSSQTIDGAATVTVGNQASGATYRSVDIVSDGANWRVV